MSKQIVLFIFALIFYFPSIGQNLICNGDFEIVDGKNVHHGVTALRSDDVQDWTMINSPDLYSGKRKNGDDCLKTALQAQSGINYVGLATMTINQPNYREFIIGMLDAPLKKDHKYLIDLYFTYGSDASFVCDNLYIFFLKNIDITEVDLYSIVLDSTRIAAIHKIKPEKWFEYRDTLTSQGNVNYIGIGNLIRDDKNLELKIRKKNVFCPDSYFYFDNLSLTPLQPENEKKESSTKSSLLDFIENRKNTNSFFSVRFKFNSDELLQEYNDSIKLLVDTLKNSALKVELVGYTDSIGRLNYNLILSKKRVEVIQEQLLKNGIQKDRIIISYLGVQNPLNSNRSEEERIMNRRVEIKLIN